MIIILLSLSPRAFTCDFSIEWITSITHTVGPPLTPKPKYEKKVTDADSIKDKTEFNNYILMHIHEIHEIR